MKKILCGIFVIIFSFVFTSCTQHNNFTENSSPPVTASPFDITPTDSPTNIFSENLISIVTVSPFIKSPTVSPTKKLNTDPPDSILGNQQVFDFGELPTGKYPYGFSSINQLINIFGEPVYLRGGTAAHYPLVFINAEFKDFFVCMWTSNSDTLNIFTNANFSVDMSFELTEAEKTQRLEILSLRITNKDAELVRGLKMGVSTKSDVLAAYPKGSENTYTSGDIDEIFYSYAFLSGDKNYDASGGNIDYSFDKNGILSVVIIDWRYFDL